MAIQTQEPQQDAPSESGGNEPQQVPQNQRTNSPPHTANVGGNQAGFLAMSQEHPELFQPVDDDFIAEQRGISGNDPLQQQPQPQQSSLGGNETPSTGVSQPQAASFKALARQVT